MPPPTAVTDFVRWFWIPEWHIAPGRVSRQHLIPFPASNLVAGPDAVELSGPATRRSHRDLTGTGWAVGALLRPAAVPAFTANPADLRDTSEMLELPELRTRVAEAMSRPAEAAERHRLAVDAFASWLAATIPPPGPEARLANAMAELVDADPEVLRVEDVADRLHISARTVQRLARRYVGLPPLTMIRRRRLQEAAQQLRADPGRSLAELASQLGYADQAHLSNDFHRVLGLTPSAYRSRDHTATAPGTSGSRTPDRPSLDPDGSPLHPGRDVKDVRVAP
ncbi:AraC family transcriptional regulator [Actinoplanes siamensis]|uniref:AraC family transcriptional regulator n=1 Tax=Actinoplanes siamensis TaxID=1223317 RepID=UPI0027DC15E5|nr:helix-turn-helix domain-containing protein [Actinoplanes siamensis]